MTACILAMCAFGLSTQAQATEKSPEAAVKVVDQGIPEVKMFPNPTTGQVYVQFKWGPKQDIRVRIYNLLGTTVAEVSERNTPGGKYRIDLSGQRPGIYFAEIQFGEEVLMQQIRVVR